MESIRIDLEKSIVVGSVSENIKKPMAFVQCMRVLTVQVRVQVRIHCFQVQVQVLKICTRVQVPSKPTTTLALTRNAFLQVSPSF